MTLGIFFSIETSLFKRPRSWQNFFFTESVLSLMSIYYENGILKMRKIKQLHQFWRLFVLLINSDIHHTSLAESHLIAFHFSFHKSHTFCHISVALPALPLAAKLHARSGHKVQRSLSQFRILYNRKMPKAMTSFRDFKFHSFWFHCNSYMLFTHSKYIFPMYLITVSISIIIQK